MRRKPLERAIRKHGFKVSAICIYEIKKLARSQSIDSASQYVRSLVAGSDHIFVHKECLEYLSKGFFRDLTNISTLGFLGDESWQQKTISNFLPMFSVPVVYDTNVKENYQSLGYNVQQLLVGTNFQKLEKLKAEKRHDVLFVGRPYGSRSDLINYLYNERYKVSVYGSREWEALIPKSVYKGYLKNKDYFDEIKSAKIVLGLMETADGTASHINSKVFDAASVGAFCIVTRHLPFYSDYHLVEGTSIISYVDKKDLSNKISYYLRAELEREITAKACREALIKTANYENLYDTLLDNYFKSQPNSSIPRASKNISDNWERLNLESDLVADDLIDEICCINSDADVIILNTEGKKRTIIKRLPIVDAGSVLVKKGKKQPLTFCGLAWVPFARRLPHFPMNSYRKKPRLTVLLVLMIETFICASLETYRERLKKIKPV